MKKILSLLVISISVLTSCNNGNSSKTFPVPSSGPDTILTPSIYFFGNTGELKLDYLYRVIKDTAGYKNIDNKIAEMTIVRDTTYYVAAFDSVRNVQGKAIPDSTGKFKIKLVGFYPFPKSNVLKDFNLNILKHVKNGR